MPKLISEVELIDLENLFSRFISRSDGFYKVPWFEMEALQEKVTRLIEDYRKL